MCRIESGHQGSAVARGFERLVVGGGGGRPIVNPNSGSEGPGRQLGHLPRLRGCGRGPISPGGLPGG